MVFFVISTFHDFVVKEFIRFIRVGRYKNEGYG